VPGNGIANSLADQKVTIADSVIEGSEPDYYAPIEISVSSSTGGTATSTVDLNANEANSQNGPALLISGSAGGFSGTHMQVRVQEGEYGSRDSDADTIEVRASSDLLSEVTQNVGGLTSADLDPDSVYVDPGSATGNIIQSVPPYFPSSLNQSGVTLTSDAPPVPASLELEDQDILTFELSP
jgi:hypothetical protein